MSATNYFQKKLRGLLLISVLGVLFVIASGTSGIVSSGPRGPALKAFGSSSRSRQCWRVPPRRQVPCLGTAEVARVDAGGDRRRRSSGGAAGPRGVYINHIKHTDSAYGTFALVLRHPRLAAPRRADDVYCAEIQHGAGQAGLAAGAARWPLHGHRRSWRITDA